MKKERLMFKKSHFAKKLFNSPCNESIQEEEKINIIKKNNSFNYTALDDLDSDMLPCCNAKVRLLVYECYTLLQIIKERGITEDNYQGKEETLNRALSTIEELAGKKLNITMLLPRPSSVTYLLQDCIKNSGGDNTCITHILDIVLEKKVCTSRMPKKKLDQDLTLAVINSGIMRRKEGVLKWETSMTSIFDHTPFRKFKTLVYGL